MRRAGVWRTLYFQVLVAIAAGVLLGILWPHLAQSLKPLGDGFIKLIRLLIAPIIFCTVVTGIAGMAKLRDVGKAGGLALVYFELVTTLALRSEEHTSELQSQSNLVCRLLLEKTK